MLTKVKVGQTPAQAAVQTGRVDVSWLVASLVNLLPANTLSYYIRRLISCESYALWKLRRV